MNWNRTVSIIHYNDDIGTARNSQRFKYLNHLYAYQIHISKSNEQLIGAKSDNHAICISATSRQIHSASAL